jgi:hypothetical protein
MAVAHASEVFPTPPFPVKKRNGVGCSKNVVIDKPFAALRRALQR